MKSEKAIISAKDYGSNKNLTEKPTMNNNKPNQNKFQLGLFPGEQPKKILQIIQCYDCHQPCELDGYRFKLMPLCRYCRTEREVEITGNRFERRHTR